MTHASQEKPPPGPTPPRRHLGQIALRRSPFVLLGVAGALGLAYLYYSRIPPLYGASAQVLVVKKRPDAVTGVDTRPLSVEDYVATQQTLIRSHLIVDRAIRKHNLASLPGFAGEREDLAEFIVTNLAVTRGKSGIQGGDNVLTLAFTGPSASECPLVLNAIIASYQDELEEIGRNIGAEAIRLMTQARDVLYKELQEKESAYRQFRQHAPLLLSRGKDEGSLRRERLSSIETKRSTVSLRKTELQGQLAAIEAGLKERGGREALLAQVAAWGAQAEAARGTPPVTLQDRLHPLLLEEQKLLETRGPKHPEVELLRQRIEVTRNLHASPAFPWQQARLSGKADTPDAVELYRQHCLQELRHVEIAEKLLSELFQKEHDSARTLTACELEDEAFRTEIDRQKGLYDGIIKQLKHIDLVKEVGGHDVRTISPPAAGKKVRPNPLTIFPGGAFLGLVGGLGLAFLVELWSVSRRSLAA